MNEPPPKTLEWIGELDGYVAMVDQTLLPTELVMLEIRDVETIWEAIKVLRVRGAPAIGIAAAMGLVLGVRDDDSTTTDGLEARVGEVADYLRGCRPTASNLFWALDRMCERARATRERGPDGVKRALLEEAKLIRDEDAAMCRRIGQIGKHLIKPNSGVLTICNAGALATAEYGTALAPMYAAHEDGRPFKAYACETRPLLQGARLTTWELRRAGIDVTLLCDGMAGELMRQGRVDLVITGADRIAANGDSANKIGTYSLAVLAKAHNLPFYVAAPSTTFDLSTSSGTDIPIEYRGEDEIRCCFGRPTAPPDAPCFSPAFDVAPAMLIKGLLTERGLIEPVTPAKIREVIQAPAPCLDT